jgi:crotonobetaine/carnitine-CoA ligase
MNAPAFASRWERAVASVPDRRFLLWDDGSGATASWTYRQFDRVVAEVAGWLADSGVTAGDGIHLVLPNSPAFVALWLAAVRAGAWILPADPQATTHELRQQIALAAPRLAVCAADSVSAYPSAAGEVDEVATVRPLDPRFAPVRGAALDWSRLPPPEPGDRAAVMFTSGTTSSPKGVQVTQANYAFAGDVMAAAAALTSAHRQLVVLPLFHANAQYYSFASAVCAGASVALMPRFSASRFLEQAARHRVTHASLFAAPMRMILARGAEPIPGFALQHVWYAQNVSDAQYHELSRVFRCRPRQLYGMTETIPAVLTNSALAPEPSAMGHPTLGCQVRLGADADGTPLPPGEVGEILVSGVPGATLFDGYLDDPAATAAAMREGWLRTGDQASVDERGYYRFEGRASEILKVAGENVSTVEVEGVLAQHPQVLEAAVIGRPDAMRDEVPVGYVVCMPGAAGVTAAVLADWCARRLAPAKRPSDIYFVDELPRTSVGKIRKFLLADQGGAAAPSVAGAR